MKTYLITGGAGFIGSNFVQYMLNKYGESIRVVNVDALTYAGNLDNLKAIMNHPGYIFRKMDICDGEGMEALFREFSFDVVVNFAAESHVDRSIKQPDIFVKTNVLGTQILLDNAKKAWGMGESFFAGKKFLQVSTDEVYGSLGAEGFFTEKTPLDPNSPYSATKAAADLLVKAYIHTYGFPANITRCSNNYGPYQFPEKLIPLMIHNALRGEKLPVYGNGKNVRDWLYVEDHAKAIDIVIENGIPGEVYNIGGNNEKENIEIVKIIIKVLRSILGEDERYGYISEDLITFVEDRKGHDKRYAIDPSKMAQDLGWFPQTPFEEGIVKTIRWYLENSTWLQNVTAGAYLKYYHEMYGKSHQ